MGQRPRNAPGKAGSGEETKEMRVRRARRGDGSLRAQTCRVPAGGWTQARKAAFLEALRETCNVQESVQRVGMSVSGLYWQRQRDRAFAQGWQEALEESYTELELLLLRHALHGAERIERSDDGKGGERRKVVHSHPHAVAMRLLLAHRQSVADYRAERGIARPGSEELNERILSKVAKMRERLHAPPEEEAGAERGVEGAGEGGGDSA